MALWYKSKINRNKIQKTEQGRHKTACLHTLKNKKPFYESSIAKVGNYFILKISWKPFFFLSTFPFETLAFFFNNSETGKTSHTQWLVLICIIYAKTVLLSAQELCVQGCKIKFIHKMSVTLTDLEFLKEVCAKLLLISIATVCQRKGKYCQCVTLLKVRVIIKDCWERHCRSLLMRHLLLYLRIK